MELKVWVEGIQRIVCGVNEETTCQDVVYALACATGRTGKFTLTERWRNNERLLAPHERPLQVLSKWGEYANDVQFILQYSGDVSSNAKSQQSSGSADVSQPLNTEENKEEGLSVSCQQRNDNVGVVKAIPKLSQISPVKSSENRVSSSINASPSHTTKAYVSQQSPTRSVERSQNTTGTTCIQTGTVQHIRPPPLYRDPPDPSVPYLRSLPPYREPPPPNQNPANRVSPLASHDNTNNTSKNSSKRSIFRDRMNDGMGNEAAYTAHYRDLVRLINYQREKLNSQQVELTKCDAEIMYWETKTKEQQHQLELLAKDTARVDSTMKHIDEQIKSLGQVEEEAEIAKQQEKTLRSELTLVRSKLANCETELLLCRNKIRLLVDEIKIEERLLAREREERSHIERSMMAEVERLQAQVEQAKRDAEMSAQIGETLRKEVALLESTVAEKKRQLEKLVADMKEANLQSLAIAPPEELKLVLEGPYKPGSTRKMIGSPRQLENAVPTSKNPHGVWV